MPVAPRRDSRLRAVRDVGKERPAWPIEQDLRAVLELAVLRGYVTTADLRLLCPHKKRPSYWMAHWAHPRQGWLVRDGKRFVPTRRAIDRLDLMESLDADAACGLSPSLVAVRRLARERGAVCPDDVMSELKCTRGSACQLLYRWTKRGFFRRTHPGTYRLPKETA
jgi:hypothetical protein